jgi:tRNA nucleotidyltransferase/poly(A) polymerase
VQKHGAETVEMIVDFAICNSQADRMKNMEVLAANKLKLNEVLRRLEEMRRRMGSLRYLSGEEVMKLLGIRPGKAVGEILSELNVAVGTGLVASKKDAEDWVLKHGAAFGKN